MKQRTSARTSSPRSKRTALNSSKHKSSKKPRRVAPPRTPTPPWGQLRHDEVPQDCGGFVSLLLQRMRWADFRSLKQRKHAAGRPTHSVSRAQFLVGLLFHYTVTWAGTFAEHLLMLGVVIAESTLSERRQALPFAVFEELLARLLRPVAAASKAAYYRGLRLVAVDGIEFSLPNTPKVKRQCRKGGNQRGRAAFAKLRCAALVELVMHNPLAARLGRAGESEWQLAKGLLGSLPEGCLLLADRLYGCAAFIGAAWRVLRERRGHCLVRVKLGMKVQRQIRRFKDGSRLVEVAVMDPEHPHRVAERITVRDIQATVRRKGYKAVKVRFWTSLLDPKQAPAEELVRLYMSRWEEELYFRELKRELGVNDLLRSQTVETAAQEVAAMVIGSSLIAGERATLRPGEELSHRISFIKTWETLEPLWLTLLLGADLLTDKQKQALADRFYWLAAHRKMAKKRSRSCPRVLRQPVQAWPRKKDQKSHAGPLHIQVLRPCS